jgi:hypothetical protein
VDTTRENYERCVARNSSVCEATWILGEKDISPTTSITKRNNLTTPGEKRRLLSRSIAKQVDSF